MTNGYAPTSDGLSPLKQFSKQRACELYRSGIRYVRDVWNEASLEFISPDLAAVKFGLRPPEFPGWEQVCRRLTGMGGRFFRQQNSTSEGDWFGVYT
jgi:hypothetical protein